MAGMIGEWVSRFAGAGSWSFFARLDAVNSEALLVNLAVFGASLVLVLITVLPISYQNAWRRPHLRVLLALPFEIRVQSWIRGGIVFKPHETGFRRFSPGLWVGGAAVAVVTRFSRLGHVIGISDGMPDRRGPDRGAHRETPVSSGSWWNSLD